MTDQELWCVCVGGGGGELVEERVGHENKVKTRQIFHSIQILPFSLPSHLHWDRDGPERETTPGRGGVSPHQVAGHSADVGTPQTSLCMWTRSQSCVSTRSQGCRWLCVWLSAERQITLLIKEFLLTHAVFQEVNDIFFSQNLGGWGTMLSLLV